MPKHLSLILLSCLVFGLATLPSLAQEPAPVGAPAASGFIAGEVLVKFQPSVPQLGIQRAIQVRDATLAEVSPYGGWLRLEVEPGREAEMLGRLRARGDVQFATYNYRIYAIGTPDDPQFGEQWGLNNTGQTGGSPDADIDASEAWDLHTGADTVTVAVIDTGVDLDHPDLQANLVAGFDFVSDDPLADDDNGHGTHVAGIAAATGDNGVGMAGVSWRARIMPIKILDAAGNGSLFDLIQGINFAADNGADIINMSLGAGCSAIDWSTVQEAIDNAVAKNILLVAASGNNNGPAVLCPAGLDEVIAVGATDEFDARWVSNSFQGSNYGSGLDVSAPGRDIYSTIPGDYGSKTGTSMATPHVAGLAALIWSFAPSLGRAEVDAVIRSSSDDLGSPGWDQFFGQGRINARRALEAVSLQTPPEIQLLLNDQTSSVTGVVELTTANPDVITWTATISPTTSWLTLVSAPSGTISAVASPVGVSLKATQPITYGVYTTTLVVSGMTSSGVTLAPRKTQVNLLYKQPYRYYFPIIYNSFTLIDEGH